MYFDHTLRALAVNLAPGVALIFVQGTDNKSKIKSKSKSKNLDYENVREKAQKIRMSRIFNWIPAFAGKTGRRETA